MKPGIRPRPQRPWAVLYGAKRRSVPRRRRRTDRRFAPYRTAHGRCGRGRIPGFIGGLSNYWSHNCDRRRLDSALNTSAFLREWPGIWYGVKLDPYRNLSTIIRSLCSLALSYSAYSSHRPSGDTEKPYAMFPSFFATVSTFRVTKLNRWNEGFSQPEKK